MREYDYNKLLAEQNTVKQLLENISPTNRVGRLSLQTRLNIIESQIADTNTKRLIKKAVITFRGKPVDRSHGITAEFSGKAIDSLNDMVASVVASINKNLKYRGPIPNREQHQLMITGTAVGSFGFELELPEPDYDVIAERNQSENALADIQRLLEYGVNGSDEQISEIVDEIHPRAVGKVSKFLEVVRNSDALFALEFNSRVFRVNTNEQLNKLIDRLSTDNIQESTENYSGEFQGVLPKSRTFEFKTSADGEIIKGKIAQDFEDPDIINREYLHKHVSISLNTITFGQSKPKYQLLDINSIHS